MGWSFYYPSTGGSGSGAVVSDGLVSPKEALAAAGIQINEALENYYLNWSNEHYTEWMVTKANGYYTDEDTSTSPRPALGEQGLPGGLGRARAQRPAGGRSL